MLDPRRESVIRVEARRRGLDEDAAVAAANARAPSTQADAEPDTTHPVADRLLIDFLPFIRVRELRSIWLGLQDRVPDDDLMCGDFQIKHGGAPSASTVSE